MPENEANLRLIIEMSPDAVITLTESGTILFVNPAAERLFERPASAMIGTEFGFPVTGKETTEIEVLSRNGELKTVEMRLVEIKWQGEKAVLLSLRDISERKASEQEAQLHLARQKAVLELYQQMVDAPVDDLLKFILKQCALLTESPFGFVGLINSDRTLMTAHLWTGNDIREGQVNASGTFPLEKAGLWAEIIRQGVPITENDCKSPDHLNNGYPGGHVPLSRFTGVPVLADNHVVAIACVANKKRPYNEFDSLTLSLLMEGVWDLVLRKKAEAALLASEISYRRLFEAAKDGILLVDAATGMILDVNPFMVELLGFSKEEFLGRTVWELGFFTNVVANKANFLELQAKGYIRYEDVPLQTADGQQIDVEFVSNVYAANSHTVIQCNIRDITVRKKLEDQQCLAHDILALLNRSESATETLRNIFKEIKKYTTFDAVAIRLREGDDFPYYVTDGFSENFLRTERFLCARNAAGELKRDTSGNPVLECMCGNIICGRTDPTLPFFTEFGSFWTNSTTLLLASTSEADRQARTRNRCHGEGYESVALIPLRTTGETIGLLQLSDHRPDRFDLQAIRFFERLAQSIGVALSRKRLQSQLSEEKAFIANALNSLTDVFYVISLEGKFLRWNKTMNVVTGYSDTEIAIMKPVDFFMGEDKLRIADAIRMATTKGSANADALFVTKDGSKIPYSFNASLLQDAKGKPSAISGIGRDMMAWIQGEQNLQAALARTSKEKIKLETIMASMGEGLSIQDRDYIITYQNRVLKDLVGDHVGEHCYTAYQQRDRICEGCPVKNAFSDGGIHQAELLITHAKESRYSEISASPLRDSQGNIVSVIEVIRDVTERKNLEAQLRQAQKMEAVGTLVGGISHDFNNILNVIMGYGVMVQDTLAANSPAFEDMRTVLQAADKAANLTRRLLIFSRKEVAETGRLDINELLRELHKMLDRIVRESIELHLELADRPLIILADAGMIEQVVMNLVINAKDAMLMGGRLSIATGLKEMDEKFFAVNGYGKQGRYAMITVSDTGQGMDAETRKRIFEPFFTTKEVGKGTGLGLAISYGIVKQHNGFIKVYSEPGQGTVFNIYLPLSLENSPSDQTKEAVVPVIGGNETILLAEDDNPLKELSTRVLESFGYRVIPAADGEEAIGKYIENSEAINLLLIDMIMPKKNGKEVAEAIKRINPRIKVLFASGYTMDILTDKELDAADYAFIRKPYRAKELLIKVREVLDK